MAFKRNMRKLKTWEKNKTSLLQVHPIVCDFKSLQKVGFFHSVAVDIQVVVYNGPE